MPTLKLNGLTAAGGEIMELQQVDLDSVYDAGVLLAAMRPPRRIVDAEVPKEVFHPREIFVYSKSFQRARTAERNPHYRRQRPSEVERALEEISYLKKSVEEIEEPDYKRHMIKFETSVGNAGARLADADIEARANITEIGKSWSEELKILDQRARGYKRMGTKVAAGAGSAATAYLLSRGFDFSNEVSVGIGGMAMLIAGYLVDRWYEGKKFRVNGRFIDSIHKAEESLRRKKVTIHMQTLAEVTDNMGWLIPGTVIYGN